MNTERTTDRFRSALRVDAAARSRQHSAPITPHCLLTPASAHTSDAGFRRGTTLFPVVCGRAVRFRVVHHTSYTVCTEEPTEEPNLPPQTLYLAGQIATQYRANMSHMHRRTQSRSTLLMKSAALSPLNSEQPVLELLVHPGGLAADWMLM